MYKLINSLTVNSRLRIVSLLILIFSAACVFLLWNTSHAFDNDLKEINGLTDLELKVWQIRNNYNSMRGDIMQIFIADPITQQSYVQEASSLLQERIDQIKEYNSSIPKEHLDAGTTASYINFDASLQEYISFCTENLHAIQTVQLNDSAQFNRIRNLLVIDLDKHFRILRANAIKVIEAVHAHKQGTLKGIDQSRTANLVFTIVISASLLGITIFVIIAISRSIISPIKETEQILQSLSAGDIPEVKEYTGQDEFSRMLRSLRLFNSHIHSLMDFVRNVAQNNFAVQAQMFEGRGPIAASLVSMRDNLQQAHTTESQRSWSSKGLAELGELIRRQQDTTTLYDKVLSFIIKYIGVNQGVLYIHDDVTHSLKLAAAYAYGRKKHLSSSLNEGEGLAGQAYLEREMIFLKQVPEGYVKITSGLGEAVPRILAISPLISNNEVFGVLEIASFQDLEAYKIEFIKKISEELAAIIKSTKVNTKTHELLRESQQQGEELKAQEEEMRQNMEELQATQEGMGRMLKEVQVKEDRLNEMLDAIPSPILVFDTNYKVIQVNKGMKNFYSRAGFKIEVGTDLLSVGMEDRIKMKILYDRSLGGEIFQNVQGTGGINVTTFFIDHYSCIRNNEGVITAGIIMSYETQNNHARLQRMAS